MVLNQVFYRLEFTRPGLGRGDLGTKVPAPRAPGTHPTTGAHACTLRHCTPALTDQHTSAHSQQVSGAGVAAGLDWGMASTCPQHTRQDSAGREQWTLRMPYQYPDSTDQTIEARADHSQEILNVLKDRLLVSVLTRARPALVWGSLHEAAVWGGDTPVHAARSHHQGCHRQTVSQDQSSRPESRCCRPRATPQCHWDPQELEGPATGQWGRSRVPGSPQFP